VWVGEWRRRTPHAANHDPAAVLLPYDKTATPWNSLLYKRVPSTVEHKPKHKYKTEDSRVECTEFLPTNGR
jgi:hypothetical protein